MSGGTARLEADRGAGAESDDFFRSSAFLDAEGVTHTLTVAAPGWEAAVPLIVRDIAGEDVSDAVSPYGYPGATLGVATGDPPAATSIDWSEAGLVSVFIRERIGGAPLLATGRDVSLVQIHDPGRERGVRPRLAEQVRANERRGYSVGVDQTPPEADLAAFHRLYTETMHRTEATERYFFTAEYLARVLQFERSWLLTARDPDGHPAAGAIAAVSDGVLHYFLGGTAEASLGDSPFKNVVVAMLDLADELGTPLNLGGGLSAGDGLERFKRGFANAELPFRAHEIVCNAEIYARLSEGRGASGAASDFFPVYRAP
jgi:hypothetical protein